MITPPTSEYREIKLTQGQVAYVSLRVFVETSSTKWQATWYDSIRGYYATRRIVDAAGKSHTILMHRQILGLELGDPRQGDHKKSGRTLDNTDGNLRIAPTKSDQQYNVKKRSDNTSGYKGVTWDKRKKKWAAYIAVQKKHMFLGYFLTKEAAYAAYCAAALKYHGEFASLV